MQSGVCSLYTIGQLGKRFGIARSTLLYYDAIGLLSPSGRSTANYRLYNDDDAGRLTRIISLRQAGLALEAIKEVLRPDHSTTSAILAQRLQETVAEIARLRQQQQMLISLLGADRQLTAPVMHKARWVSMLRAAGLDEEGMDRWHAEFERSSPLAHQDFLESLGLTSEAISHIRQRARDASSGNR